jgi:hypothetical protein
MKTRVLLGSLLVASLLLAPLPSPTVQAICGVCSPTIRTVGPFWGMGPNCDAAEWDGIAQAYDAVSCLVCWEQVVRVNDPYCTEKMPGVFQVDISLRYRCETPPC